MKAAVVVAHGRFGHQQDHGGAFADGLRRHGWKVSVQTRYNPADLIVFWGVRRHKDLASAKRDGCHICILERGYVGNRFDWTSVSFGGGINGQGIYYGPLDDPSRWENNFGDLLREYDHPSDGYALIMGQLPGDSSVKPVQIRPWYEKQITSLQELGYDVRFRPHPRHSSHGIKGTKNLKGDLYNALRGAKLVVTLSSNSGVDAALYGRPVIAMDSRSMAWEVAGHDLDEVVVCDRRKWAHALAWKQWTKEEIRSGYCWDVVRKGLGL